jgi:predicted dehydrogenase
MTGSWSHTVRVPVCMLLCSTMVVASCGRPPARFTGAPNEVKIMTLDPGHFHAGLVHKFEYEQVDPVVHIFAPEGRELESHLALLEQFNRRTDNPTNWNPQIHRGEDYLERMLEEKPGNVMVVAGNNARKIEYIRRAIEADVNVLADKPMIIRPADFPTLRDALEAADRRGLVVNDIMTERHAVTNVLQRELAGFPDLIGDLEAGTPEDPAIVKESVHFFYKTVAGEPLVRPAWFFDVTRQGEAIVDVSTHLVDQILWQLFPGQPIDYRNRNDGVEVLSARTWTTPMTLEQFRRVTHEDRFPAYLLPHVSDDGTIPVTANGEFVFTVRGIHGKVSAQWGFENPGGGDTHYSVLRGTRANLVIRQDAETGYLATLYVEPAGSVDPAESRRALDGAIETLADRYPGLAVRGSPYGWEIVVPVELRESHEDHFTRVAQRYLDSLVAGRLPEWERSNLLTKYYLTTQAYEVSR